MAVKPIPEGYHSVTPYLIVKGAARAIDFYKQAFGATEIMRFPGPNNTVMHAEIQIGDSRIMVNDPVMDNKGPKALGGSPASLWLYVEDCDALFKRGVGLRDSIRPLPYLSSSSARITLSQPGSLDGERLGSTLEGFFGGRSS